MAVKIADKLNAKINTKTGNHDIAKIYYGDKLIASFGIRRGSRKDLGHDYIPSQLYISKNQARQLGMCPMSAAEYFVVIGEKGMLD
jgi:hypothetical protein